MTADSSHVDPRVVVTDYRGPGASRSAYRMARQMARERGQIVVVHPLDPMLNFFGAVIEDVAGAADGTVLDQIDHRISSGGLEGHDDEMFVGPLAQAVLAAAHRHGAVAIVVGEDLGIHDAHLPVTVAPAE
jgi:hypothetical protein